MRTVLFVRHAEAGGGSPDHERPLTAGGQRTACAIGRFIARVGPLPDLIFTSSALRARQTLQCARAEGHFSAPIHTSEALYETSPRRLLEEIRYAPDPAGVLLLVGHEPAGSQTIGRFTGTEDLFFPAGSLASVDLPIRAWADAAFGHGELVWLVPSTLLRALGLE